MLKLSTLLAGQPHATHHADGRGRRAVAADLEPVPQPKGRDNLVRIARCGDGPQHGDGLLARPEVSAVAGRDKMIDVCILGNWIAQINR
jgi:hypothetical protein